jgi:glyoxylase-like metal-dependent hydrolase (beta-lactamase superfamily II)
MPYFQVHTHGPVTEIVMSPSLAGRPLFPFRAYLVDGLLIDTGPPISRAQMAAFLREHRVEQVVNTHHHEDHAGNNALINAQLGLVPVAHALAVPLLAELPPIQLYRKLTWRSAPPSRVAAVGDTLTTPRYRFEILHTPGHADDHIVLHERNEGWLFTGDLYIADRLKLLRREEDPHVMMTSLERALAADFDRIFCAHRGPVSDGHRAMTRKLDSMAEFGHRVRELHAAGLGAREIMARLMGREDRFMATFSAGDFTRQNLVEAFLPTWPGPAPMPKAGSSR